MEDLNFKQLHDVAFGTQQASVYDSYEHSLDLCKALFNVALRYSTWICAPHGYNKLYWDPLTRTAIVQNLLAIAHPIAHELTGGKSLSTTNAVCQFLTGKIYLILRERFDMIDNNTLIVVDESVTYKIHEEVTGNPILRFMSGNKQKGNKYHNVSLFQMWQKKDEEVQLVYTTP